MNPFDLPEGEDPREALELAYQRLVAQLHAAQTAVDEQTATRRRIERALGELSDADDASQLQARHAEADARVDVLRQRADALRERADRCRADRNHVRALADLDAARALARTVLAEMRRHKAKLPPESG